MTVLSLPARTGARPRTGPSVPHVQLSQNSPDGLRERLKLWMTGHLHGAVIRPSEISEPGSLAFFLDGLLAPSGTVLLPPRLNAEFVHVHPDGSLHLALSQDDQRELIAKGWGERHPLYSPTINVVMLYGPRTDNELEIAKTVVAASYHYATGGPSAAGPAAHPDGLEAEPRSVR
ncbi:luciferase domain-containing protein [Spongiactinospora rosea]|uniref:luciferase domain-containing protein n=1 Tax=Spongiactinospora rosea TaxID=2248750 RepID=UPI0018F2F65B|nr:luciferase family protein [Spongiactinospora rosea]